MKMLRLYIFIIMSIIGMPAEAQSALTDSLHYHVEVQTSLANGDHTPFWLNANKYGLSSLEKSNGYVRGTLTRPLSADDDKKWGVGYGLDLALAYNYTSTLVVQQAYVEGRWLKGTLTLGSKEHPMGLKNQELSTGSQTLGINARPIPQARIALPDYWTIPGTKDWLALKGHIAYGLTTDDAWQKDFTQKQNRYTEHALHHSKAGYLRVGPKNITLELGLEMACQFGGKNYLFYEGEPSDVFDNDVNLKSFWHAFVPGGSDASDGDYQNASGNHLGSWVACLNFDYPTWALGLYADQFFEDHSSMFHVSSGGYGTGDERWVKKESRFFLHDFKDWLLGAELKLKQLTWLNAIVAEYMYTKYQGGPVYHDHTSVISENICGRDDFYNHNLYTGWQHWGMVMGNPLYRSPIYNADGNIEVYNNRFVACHLGFAGDPAPGLHYRVLATWQRGYGTYDRLFREPEENVSLLGEACYSLPSGWSVKAAVGLDSGEIYGDNKGVQLTIAKTGLLNFKKGK